jgi:hypothetical protein
VSEMADDFLAGRNGMVVAILGKEEEEEYLHGDIYKHQPVIVVVEWA